MSTTSVCSYDNPVNAEVGRINLGVGLKWPRRRHDLAGKYID